MEIAPPRLPPVHSFCLFLASRVRRQGSRISLSVLARKTQVQQLLPTTGHWLPESQAPSKSPGSESRHVLRVLKCKESPSPLLFYLPESTKSQRQKQQTSQELKTHHAAELTLLRVAEWPLPTFSSTMTDEQQPDNTLLVQTVASLWGVQTIKGQKFKIRERQRNEYKFLIFSEKAMFFGDTFWGKKKKNILWIGIFTLSKKIFCSFESK